MSTPALDDATDGGSVRDLCVTYLAWGPLGVTPLREFLASYHEHPSGRPHRLVVLFNGVAAGASRDLLLAELEHTDHELIVLERPVLDLLAYRQAAELLGARRYCLLNSYSRIVADDWLLHMDRALAQPDVGLAAATGSWASMISLALFSLGLPSAYAKVFDDRAATLRELEQLNFERTGNAPSSDPVRRWLARVVSVAPTLVGFTRFPAHHVRSNAMAIEHDVLMSASRSSLRRKVQAHRLESGRSSFTRQVERRGLRVVVVDRFGQLYDPPDWAASETFWQGAQRGLLVADNQTADYDAADAARRLLLSRYAWGDRAAPL
jgi:hypothetical protein